jgi:hypothetical protein
MCMQNMDFIRSYVTLTSVHPRYMPTYVEYIIIKIIITLL